MEKKGALETAKIITRKLLKLITTLIFPNVKLMASITPESVGGKLMLALSVAK